MVHSRPARPSVSPVSRLAWPVSVEVGGLRALPVPTNQLLVEPQLAPPSGTAGHCRALSVWSRDTTLHVHCTLHWHCTPTLYLITRLIIEIRSKYHLPLSKLVRLFWLFGFFSSILSKYNISQLRSSAKNNSISLLSCCISSWHTKKLRWSLMKTFSRLFYQLVLMLFISDSVSPECLAQTASQKHGDNRGEECPRCFPVLK